MGARLHIGGAIEKGEFSLCSSFCGIRNNQEDVRHGTNGKAINGNRRGKDEKGQSFFLTYLSVNGIMNNV